jgi:calcineurin-binding protein cabin-1|uniref:calcineurin-binding protein cabin-1-like n=1 Tax=Oncorhynchus gorbuscha TaxID=8017 RepID=UPI001EAEE76F|nr:calcineurin-binding protein cabin-1-like [Oncorhynchus gorbuscha]
MMTFFLFSWRLPQNYLLKLKDYRQCLECTEVALNEALQQLNSVPVSSHTAKEEWFSTITMLLGGFEVCFTEDPQLLRNINHYTSMARLANNLIWVNTHTNIPGRDKVCLETENDI